MEFALYVLSGALAVGTAVTLIVANRYQLRWGQRVAGTTSVAGDSIYREGPTLPVYQQRGIPVPIHALSIFAIAWGLLTGFIFAPAGLLYLILVVDAGSSSLLYAFGSMALVAVCLSGFGLAVSLCRSSKALLKRDHERALKTGRWSALHHLAVIGAFALLYTVEPGVFVAAALPCVLGFGHALFFVSAARNVADEERASSLVHGQGAAGLAVGVHAQV